MAPTKKRIRKPYKNKPIKPFYKKKFFWAGTIFLISTILIFYIVFFFNFFWIKNINIISTTENANQEILDIINNKIEKRFIFLSSKSIFLFNSSTTENYILNLFPSVLNIEINKKFPNSLIVEIKKRKPVVYWRTNDNLFLMDVNGIIFAHKSSLDPRRVIIENNVSGSLGDQVVSPVDLQKIMKIWTAVGKDLEIIEFEISDQKLNALTSKNWRIFFSPNKDINNQLLNLELVLNEKISPERRNSLNYIDLRFDNRVYFK